MFTWSKDTGKAASLAPFVAKVPYSALAFRFLHVRFPRTDPAEWRGFVLGAILGFCLPRLAST